MSWYYEDWEPTVLERNPVEIHTGLLDARGEPIIYIEYPRPVGFFDFRRYRKEPREG